MFLSLSDLKWHTKGIRIIIINYTNEDIPPSFLKRYLSFRLQFTLNSTTTFSNYSMMSFSSLIILLEYKKCRVLRWPADADWNQRKLTETNIKVSTLMQEWLAYSLPQKKKYCHIYAHKIEDRIWLVMRKQFGGNIICILCVLCKNVKRRLRLLDELPSNKHKRKRNREKKRKTDLPKPATSHSALPYNGYEDYYTPKGSPRTNRSTPKVLKNIYHQPRAAPG